MCRMYGHRAAQAIPLEGMLLGACHSLRTQATRDWRGETHADGWGIGYYESGKPQRIRSPRPAFEDDEFSSAAKQISSATAIGHVRQASVGDLTLANVHPFTYGPWTFVHNGTVQNFAQLRDPLVAETDADLRQQVGGTTDSEQVFFWLLSRLRKTGQPAEEHCHDLPRIANEMAAAIRTLDARAAATQPAEPTRLNFILTDGEVFLASRFRHSLHWTNCHGPFTDGRARGVAVASEPIGEEPWSEVPDRSVLAVDRDFIVYWFAI